MTGRVLYAGLELLDRQLRDRHGRLCGKVDDLELERSPETGELYVTAIVAGPGALLQRMGRRRLGGWIERANRLVNDPEQDRNLIPLALAISHRAQHRPGRRRRGPGHRRHGALGPRPPHRPRSREPTPCA